jgi:hypothetical protein
LRVFGACTRRGGGGVRRFRATATGDGINAPETAIRFW